ncbi:MAG TPA: hypothetical protein VGM06_01675 [Polyangiaceae bacterium]|jgi:hypothetical protein
MLNPTLRTPRMNAIALPTVREILDRYRQTFLGTQIMVGVITLFTLMKTHRVLAALGFFATMQVGALVGAAWGARLKTMFERARMGVGP